MKVYTAPESVGDLDEPAGVFLAGSIEMNTAEDWQLKVIQELDQYPVALFNPRRSNWDSSWVQSIDNPEFKGQVTWELDLLERADIVFFYFDPKTKSPITLMELGFISGLRSTKPVIVVCADGFWRQGNVEIMCERNELLFVKTLDEGIHVLKQAICDYTRQLAH